MNDGISIGEAMRKGIDTFKSNFLLCVRVVLLTMIALTVASFAISLLAWAVGAAIAEADDDAGRIVWICLLGTGGLLLLLLVPFIHAGWAHLLVGLLRGQPGSLRAALEGFRHGLRPLTIGVCFFGLFIASAVTGFILLPLLIWAAIFAYTEITEGRTQSPAVAIHRGLHAARVAPVRLGLVTFLSWLIYQGISLVLFAVPMLAYLKAINFRPYRVDYLVVQLVWGLLTSSIYFLSPLMVVATFDRARARAQQLFGPDMDNPIWKTRAMRRLILQRYEGSR